MSIKKPVAYQYLVAILNQTDISLIKEYSDIALVASSYDLKTALYLDQAIIDLVNDKKPIELVTSIAMMIDFSIPIFSERSQLILDYQVTQSSLSHLEVNSQHLFIFK